MSKILCFTKSNMGDVRNTIQEKLDELKELGLEISLGRITFENDSFKTKMSVKLEHAEDPAVKEFQRSVDSFNYPNAIGKTVIFQQEEYIFKGFKPRATKNKAIIEKVSDGKSFVTRFGYFSDQLKEI